DRPPSAPSRRVTRRRRRCTAPPAPSSRRPPARRARRTLREAKPRRRTTWWTRSLEPTKPSGSKRGAVSKRGGASCFLEVLEQPDVAGLVLGGESEMPSVPRGNRISHARVGRRHANSRPSAEIGAKQLELILVAAGAGEEQPVSISPPSGEVPIATRADPLLGHLLLGEV